MIYHEMLVRNSLIHVCSNSVKMFESDIIFCSLWFYAHVKIWRNVWNILVTYLFLFTCSNSDDISAMTRISQFMIVFACSWLKFSYVSIRTRCFDNWFISRLRLIIALHMREYSSFDEMLWQTIYISQFSTFVTCSNSESCSTC